MWVVIGQSSAKRRQQAELTIRDRLKNFLLSYLILLCSHGRMKRNPDLIRDLMLALEAAEGAELLRVPDVQGYARHEIDHHFRLLVEAGLASAAHVSSDGRRWVAVRLTWSGHDYLDTIRDGRVWKHTKAAMKKTGFWSLETMGLIARTIILERLEALGIGPRL